MIWIILISFIVALIAWIMLGPVIIYADTEGKRYFLTLPAVLRAELVPDREMFSVRGRIFFVPYRFNPFDAERQEKKKKDPDKRKTGGRRHSLRNIFWLGRKLIGSFRIRKLELDIDTDDFILNSYLVPAFSAVNGNQINMQVNFSGEIALILDVRTRLGRLLWILIKYNFKSKFNF